MNDTQIASTPRVATVAGLLVAAAGIAVLYVSGVDMPVVPPGLVLLVVAALLVAFIPWRWTPIVALVVTLAEFGGFFASGSAAGLVELEAAGVLVGTWARLIGLVVALVAGVVLTVSRFRTLAAARS